MSLSSDEIAALLPFHVNGTLMGAEAEAVAEALAADPALAAEAAALAAIRQTMQADDDGVSPGELGLARLTRATAAKAPPRVRPVIWQIAAALLLAIALMQGAVLLMERGQPGFQLAGAPRPDFTLALRPEAPEAAIRALLQAAGAEIVAGPSALGLYSLAVVNGLSLDDAYDLLSASEIVESVSRNTP